MLCMRNERKKKANNKRKGLLSSIVVQCLVSDLAADMRLSVEVFPAAGFPIATPSRTPESSSLSRQIATPGGNRRDLLMQAGNMSVSSHDHTAASSSARRGAIPAEAAPAIKYVAAVVQYCEGAARRVRRSHRSSATPANGSAAARGRPWCGWTAALLDVRVYWSAPVLLWAKRVAGRMIRGYSTARRPVSALPTKRYDETRA
jgi:hypothetical protein